MDELFLVSIYSPIKPVLAWHRAGWILWGTWRKLGFAYSAAYLILYSNSFGGGFDFMGGGDKDGLMRGMESALKWEQYLYSHH